VHTVRRELILLAALVGAPVGTAGATCQSAAIPALWSAAPAASVTPRTWKDFRFSLEQEGISVVAFIGRYGRPNAYLACPRPNRSELVYNLASGESLHLFVTPPSPNFLAMEVRDKSGRHRELVK
jgi:hypothetical protein